MKTPSLTKKMSAFVVAWADAHEAKSPKARKSALSAAARIAATLTPDENVRVQPFLGLTKGAAR